MTVSSRYSDTYTRDIVTVSQIGARGATCKTSYGAEINVLWGANLPSPVPQIGERWYITRISPSKWAFDSKITGTSYNLMRYAMELDIWSCIGRERSTVDDIAESGVSELYLTVGEGGVVYWDSEVASSYGLNTCQIDGKPVDYVRQVVNRCRQVGMSVVLVIDCNLWSDITNEEHNYYQQLRLSESYVGAMGWYALLDNVWDDVDNYTWGKIREAGVIGKGEQTYVPTWSFVTAKDAIKSLVDELYLRYSNDVRGVCFRNWCVDGAYADVSDFVSGEFMKNHNGTLLGAMSTDRFSDEWWERRDEIMRFYAGLQIDFINRVKSDIGNWPVSVIVPTKMLSLESERVGRFDTWLDDDFSSYGWSKVGCLLDYSKSVDRAYELRSFEFLVASLQRFAEDSSALYRVDVQGSSDYDGLFNVLAKYNVTNVLLDDYEHWRLLSDQQVINLKTAMNTSSVTPITVLDEVGFYFSNNSKEIAYYDEFDPNRFQRTAQDFCITLLDRLPHRLRFFYDDDLERVENTRGLSSLVLFQSLNMSDTAIDEIGKLVAEGGRNVVIIGRCGMFSASGTTKREILPFLSKFGEVDYGVKAYEGQLDVKGGRLGAFDEVYVMDGECVGINPTRKIDPASPDVDVIGVDSYGNEVAAPVYFNNRSSMIAIDILDEPSLMDMASEMVLLAIGRDR